MKKGIWIVLMLVWGVHSVMADNLQCLRYDPKAFIASDKWVPLGESFPPDTLVEPIEDIYLLKLPKMRKKDFQNHISIAVKAGGKMYQNHHISCESEKGRYYCRGECDSGQVWLDHKMRLKLQFVTYSEVQDYGNGLGGPVLLLDLRPKDKEKWIEGKKVACPKELKQGNFVCYGKKKRGKYFSCKRSQESCESIGDKHFGRYGDESSTRAALMRCYSSKPKN